jgi:ribosome-associated toxin RatA of RatAB toxin-antitoxin module
MRHAPLLVVLLLAAAAVARADDDRQAKLDHGEILVDAEEVPGSEVPRILMEGVIDAPPAVVWEIIQHCAEYRKILPRIAESEELSREGDVVRCRTVVETPWPMKNLSSINRAVHTTGGGVWKREWKLESGDYLMNEGSWTLTPFDAAGGRTRVVYRVRTQPKSSVPHFVQGFAQKKALPDVLAAIRNASLAAAKAR